MSSEYPHTMWVVGGETVCATHVLEASIPYNFPLVYFYEVLKDRTSGTYYYQLYRKCEAWCIGFDYLSFEPLQKISVVKVHAHVLDDDFLVCIERNPGPPKKGPSKNSPAGAKGGRKSFNDGLSFNSLLRTNAIKQGEQDAMRAKIAELKQQLAAKTHELEKRTGISLTEKLAEAENSKDPKQQSEAESFREDMGWESKQKQETEVEQIELKEEEDPLVKFCEQQTARHEASLKLAQTRDKYWNNSNKDSVPPFDGGNTPPDSYGNIPRLFGGKPRTRSKPLKVIRLGQMMPSWIHILEVIFSLGHIKSLLMTYTFFFLAWMFLGGLSAHLIASGAGHVFKTATINQFFSHHDVKTFEGDRMKQLHSVYAGLFVDFVLWIVRSFPPLWWLILYGLFYTYASYKLKLDQWMHMDYQLVAVQRRRLYEAGIENDRRPAFDRLDKKLDRHLSSYQICVEVYFEHNGRYAYYTHWDTLSGLPHQWFKPNYKDSYPWYFGFFSNSLLRVYKLKQVALDETLLRTALNRKTLLASRDKPEVAIDTMIRMMSANPQSCELYNRLLYEGESMYRDMALVCGAIVTRSPHTINQHF